ncbi:heterogeneous nuclear ribonucleoprotein R [Vigna unguiculata]|uniref:Heterogeneous nuclear ribonucleoprotein R n=1 Tax=Vigna unguiculata TaxID=3917 RepID=A0A4D6MCG6_VIGUN|nr:heterogeneous nuclear ribonucleoprotein R [Vigna unguiculata]
MPGTGHRDVLVKNPESPEGNSEPEKPTDSDEQVDFDGDNDQEETMEEEEVEYEEVEEEEEVEVEEEEEEEEEGEEEEEIKPSDVEDETGVEDTEDEKKKHAELLALPPHGSEVYIGGIPPKVSEEDLNGFCQSVGEVSEVRIMKGKESGEAKGYAFVTFKTKELASKAIKELNNTELKGKKIKCSTSQAKHRLFIGNVPRNWTEENMEKVVSEIGPGIISVELLKDPQISGRNRGFAFIEYYNNACAEYSRQKMSNSNFKLGSNAPTVSWADPRNYESSANSQVKALYVKNLPGNITQDRLKELFEHHGKITKVVVPSAKAGQEKSRYGFVHFAERSSAMKALKNTEKYEIDGQTLECSLAKPQADQKSSGAANQQKSALLPTYPPHLGYGMIGGAIGAGYGAAGFAQPLMYGPGPTPPGMTMMPMLLPDGRIGYVLQQPGFQQHAPMLESQHRKRGGGSSSGKRSNDNNRNSGGGRYHPY